MNDYVHYSTCIFFLISACGLIPPLASPPPISMVHYYILIGGMLCLLLLEIKCGLSKQGGILSYLLQYKMTSVSFFLVNSV